jgi:hypothetical protein
MNWKITNPTTLKGIRFKLYGKSKFIIYDEYLRIQTSFKNIIERPTNFITVQ